MDWQSEQRSGSLVVVPSGPIDHDNAEYFEARLMESVSAAAERAGLLVVDFREVPYMSSVGLRVLTRANRAAGRSSVSIVVANLGETLREIFEISRFDKLFPVYDSIEAAVASVRA
jgi:anti-sigma B factor antagonist